MDHKKPRTINTLAGALVAIGAGAFALERLGLMGFRRIEGQSAHIDGNLLSLLIILPFALIVAGCLLFVVSRLRH